MTEITFDQVFEIANEIVAEFGDDHRYEQVRLDGYNVPQCAYSDAEGAPSCIVGHVMDRLGITLPAPGATENTVSWGTPRMRNNIRALGLSFSKEADDFLRDLQFRQDGGDTWGVAVSGAEYYVRQLNSL